MATTQQYAYLSERVYDEPDINKVYQAKDNNFYTAPDGHKYRVIENMSNPQTGYQGTIYQDMSSGEIIVAHRGTKGSQDIATDIDMVRAKTNNQIDDAMRLVEHAKQHAKDYQQLNHLSHAPTLSITGHSLGGTLAEVTAYRQNLHGETFNAYGAVGMRGMPAYPITNSNVVNHVIATDAVSAANEHYGEVRTYARTRDIAALVNYGYGQYNPMPDNPTPLAVGSLAASHSIQYFTSAGNVLSNPQYSARAHEYNDMIQTYRHDVHSRRDTIHEVFRAFDHMPHQPPSQMFQPKIWDDRPMHLPNPSGLIGSEQETIPPQYRQLHSQVDQHIRQLYQERAIPFSNGGENTVMSCTAQAYQRGFDKVDQIKVKDGEIALFTQQPFGYQVAQINALEAANIPVQTSLQQMNDWAQQMQVAQLAQAQNQSQGMSMSMVR